MHRTGSLNDFMALGASAWAQLRAQVTEWLTEPSCRRAVEPHLFDLAAVELHLPVEIADYVPLAALEAARVAPPARDPEPLPYLRDAGHPWGLDLTLELRVNGELVSRPPFAGTYWTGAQQLAHLTVNGASLRTGDLFASGTVSGPGRDQVGSLIELTDGGRQPIRLADGTTRTFLEDGDVVTIAATAPGPDGAVIGFGEVTGRVEPAR